jgi:hypothetical protein
MEKHGYYRRIEGMLQVEHHQAECQDLGSPVHKGNVKFDHGDWGY